MLMNFCSCAALAVVLTHNCRNETRQNKRELINLAIADRGEASPLLNYDYCFRNMQGNNEKSSASACT